MRPGPGAPYHARGMRMMGSGPTRQGFGSFGGSFMGPMGPPQSRMNPMMMGVRQPARQGGGILARLLGKGQGAGANFRGLGGAVQGAQRAAGGGGGLLQSLANPASINGFLTNTQKVLQTAQQVGPMIQQYGPLVKNLPAMWKLYRGLKDLPDQEQDPEVTETTPKESKQESNTSRKSRAASASSKRSTRTQSQNESTSGTGSVTKNSTPKLFI